MLAPIPVKQIHPATRDDIGDLASRPLPSPTLDRLGAFLFLNHHGPQTYAPGNNGLPFRTSPAPWLARLKMTPPRYVGLQRDAIPAIVEDGGRAVINLISGCRNGVEGPIHSLTGVFMSTIQFKAGGRIQFDGLRDRNVFLYIVRGEVGVGGQNIGAFRLVELGEGDMVAIEGRMDAYIYSDTWIRLTSL